MLQLRPAHERGHTRYAWLNSYHSFSFGDYFDPRQMGVSNLRVINDDIIAPAGGFPTHGHRDMEIVTYVLSGALQHKDSMGNGSLIRPGDVQRMSAGSGIRHSEFNASQKEPVHLLQIWLQPNRRGVKPGYAQRHFPVVERQGRLYLLVSPDGRDGSISTQQDACLYTTILDKGEAVDHPLTPDRQVYLHLASGSVQANGERLSAGDGALIKGEDSVVIAGLTRSELLLFDL
ncbi:MAG: pirin family protein [Pseudomonadota bacterium]